ncbi:hypothetical protein [Leeuwenhoekiella marinoflava]
MYTVDGKNVAGLGRFKNHFGVWFFNAALLKLHSEDKKNMQSI